MVMICMIPLHGNVLRLVTMAYYEGKFYVMESLIHFGAIFCTIYQTRELGCSILNILPFFLLANILYCFQQLRYVEVFGLDVC